MKDLIYTSQLGKKFMFNDPIKITMTFLEDAKVIGRLIQVRKGCGAFGSDVYLVRIAADERLASFSNAGIERYTDKELPIIQDDIKEGEKDSIAMDSEDIAYSIQEEFYETGFIIEKPLQPEPDAPMIAMTVTEGKTIVQL